MGNAKKLFVMAIAIVMIFALAACGGNEAAAEPEPTPEPPKAEEGTKAEESVDTGINFDEIEPLELVWSHQQAPGGVGDQQVNCFIEALSEESGGKITIKAYNAGTLASNAEAYEVVTTGRVDIVEQNSSYFSPYISEVEMLEVPGVYWGDVNRSLGEVFPTLKDPFNAILAEHNLIMFAPFGADFYAMVGKTVVDDPAAVLKGQRVRVSGKWNGVGVEEWGGSPVSIPIGEVSTALERGTVDYVLTAWAQIDGFKMYEIQPHVTMTTMQEVFCGHVTRKDLWDSLSPAQLAAFERATETYLKADGRIVENGREDFVKRAEEYGAEFYYMTDEDYIFLRESAWNIIDSEFLPGADDKTKALIEACRGLSKT